MFSSTDVVICMFGLGEVLERTVTLPSSVACTLRRLCCAPSSPLSHAIRSSVGIVGSELIAITVSLSHPVRPIHSSDSSHQAKLRRSSSISWKGSLQLTGPLAYTWKSFVTRSVDHVVPVPAKPREVVKGHQEPDNISSLSRQCPQSPCASLKNCGGSTRTVSMETPFIMGSPSRAQVACLSDADSSSSPHAALPWASVSIGTQFGPAPDES